MSSAISSAVPISLGARTIAVLAAFAAAVALVAAPQAASAQTAPPSTVETTVEGNVVTATVLDADGTPVETSVPVRFTVPGGSVDTECVMTTDGVASATVTLASGETQGTVVVTADWNVEGDDATCEAAGSEQFEAAASVGVEVGNGDPDPQEGEGTFETTPAFSAGSPGLAQVVFNGGTMVQLTAAMEGAGAGGVWAQDASGDFVLYISGAPEFANAPFTSAFPSGFTGVTALTLVEVQ